MCLDILASKRNGLGRWGHRPSMARGGSAITSNRNSRDLLASTRSQAPETPCRRIPFVIAKKAVAFSAIIPPLGKNVIQHLRFPNHANVGLVVDPPGVNPEEASGLPPDLQTGRAANLTDVACHNGRA